ncbi:autophagy-related protein 101-like [Schistocerca americana]|uniref:autophagy-related protein 101-like n=1 Tax=Schistocerca americana TaxID=7009 RepID=UPI001F4F1593|nr:autophagy-related protein 101-like [Schistocerca americana]XP_049766821.1 autophagy-related protein 101-like [Schistocerca cancellata]XP_049794815.1 autophagy-related protein 101-like [Schistocerca nitens]XP_049839244.1 autophagy-related protein 101-like [Schistocerca gregaria]XP_049941273.1 autophagy-related protein 101-like [Schistocerca serialis cubense]
MNARSQTLELTVEPRQVKEAVASLFHTVLFHRTVGKFEFIPETPRYTVGTIGFCDVDCDFIDLTYVCCDSEDLDRNLKKEISAFSDSLHRSAQQTTGQISLEFFQRKKNRWPFPIESTWEVWTVRVEIIRLNSEYERELSREKVGDMLTEKILYIVEVMNRNSYIPEFPVEAEVDLVFDTTYEGIQPYLFKLSHTLAGPPNNTVGLTMKKLWKETLTY